MLTHTLADRRERASADMHPDFDFRRTRLAALFHDVGKPQTRGFQQGKGVTFHHHGRGRCTDDTQAPHGVALLER